MSSTTNKYYELDKVVYLLENSDDEEECENSSNSDSDNDSVDNVEGREEDSETE